MIEIGLNKILEPVLRKATGISPHVDDKGVHFRNGVIHRFNGRSVRLKVFHGEALHPTAGNAFFRIHAPAEIWPCSRYFFGRIRGLPVLAVRTSFPAVKGAGCAGFKRRKPGVALQISPRLAGKIIFFAVMRVIAQTRFYNLEVTNNIASTEFTDQAGIVSGVSFCAVHQLGLRPVNIAKSLQTRALHRQSSRLRIGLIQDAPEISIILLHRFFRKKSSGRNRSRRKDGANQKEERQEKG